MIRPHRAIAVLATVAALAMTMVISPHALAEGPNPTVDVTAVPSWDPPVEVGRGNSRGAARPVMTSAGHALVYWIKDHRPVYAWKPFGGAWAEEVRLYRGIRSSSHTLIATGPERVTFAWSEKNDDGQTEQLYTRWVDADGTRGKVRPIGAPSQAVPNVVTVASSTMGSRAVVSHYGKVHRVMTRTAGGDWTEGAPFPYDRFLVKAVAIDDAGRVTVLGQTRDHENPRLMAVSSTAGGPWSTRKLGPRPGWSVETPNISMTAKAGPRGDLVVLWKEFDPESEAKALVAGYGHATATDATWSVEVLEDVWGCSSDVCARAGLDAGGNAAALWVVPASDSLVDVRFARLDAGERSWGAVDTLLSSVPNGFNPQVLAPFVSVAPAGDVVLTYPDFPDPQLYTFLCPPGPAASCSQAGFLAGPPINTWVRMVAGPEASAVAMWEPCWLGCRPHRIMAQSLEPTG